MQVLYADTEKAARAFRTQRGPAGPVRGPPETFFISPDGTVLGYKISTVTEALLDVPDENRWRS